MKFSTYYAQERDTHPFSGRQRTTAERKGLAPGVHSEYLGRGLQASRRLEIRREAQVGLAEHAARFEAIAFMGLSGALVAPMLADMLNKDLIVVRKDGDKAHSRKSVEGVDCGHYLIVDDFISTGTTIETIIRRIKGASIAGEPVGVYLWNAWRIEHRELAYDTGDCHFITIPVWGSILPPDNINFEVKGDTI